MAKEQQERVAGAILTLPQYRGHRLYQNDAKSLQNNGICVRLHRAPCNRVASAEEFYDIAFGKKIYDSMDTMKDDIDKWI